MFGEIGKLLIDTDIFIDHLRGQSVAGNLLKRIIVDGDFRGFYSSITEIELFSAEVVDDEQAVDISMLLGSLVRLDISSSIARNTGFLLGKFRKSNGLEMADAIIAATALNYSLPLVSRNVKHYNFIPGLLLSSPDLY